MQAACKVINIFRWPFVRFSEVCDAINFPNLAQDIERVVATHRADALACARR